MKSSSSPKSRRRRSGVAATELAVCLPVLMLLVLATIESCTMIFLKQSLTVAAYEGTRSALEQNAVPGHVRQAIRDVLDERGVSDGNITLNPPNFHIRPQGSYIEITVSAPADGNSILPVGFYRGRTLSATATMMKEF